MEYRELYDENRNPLGIAITKGEPVPANAYMLTVGIWIVNDQKQILLTRRSLEKTLRTRNVGKSCRTCAEGRNLRRCHHP